MANVAILGYGVVGSGVSEVIRNNSKNIRLRAGEDIVVKKILDIKEIPAPDNELLTKLPEDVFNDDSIDIVVETIGVLEISYNYTKRALESGKHVVTSNKELVATYGPELLKLAKENNVSYLFEASVGGGIPIIRPLCQCLAANEIHSVKGILNGTTNYILTRMKKDGSKFDEALKEAKAKGYAEANPTADIEGMDACRKIAILSSIAYDEFVDYRNITTEGISKITLADMEFAEEMGCVIKLLAVSKRRGDKIYARVSPAMIAKSHPLAGVEDVFNAILVKGNAVGDVMFYGQGAGKLPTASAVVADIIDIVRNKNHIDRCLWERKSYCNVADIDDCEAKFFVRLTVTDNKKAMDYVRERFGDVEFAAAKGDRAARELAFVTKTDREKVLREKIKNLSEADCIANVENVIYVEED